MDCGSSNWPFVEVGLSQSLHTAQIDEAEVGFLLISGRDPFSTPCCMRVREASKRLLSFFQLVRVL